MTDKESAFFHLLLYILHIWHHLNNCLYSLVPKSKNTGLNSTQDTRLCSVRFLYNKRKEEITRCREEKSHLVSLSAFKMIRLMLNWVWHGHPLKGRCFSLEEFQCHSHTSPCKHTLLQTTNSTFDSQQELPPSLFWYTDHIFFLVKVPVFHFVILQSSASEKLLLLIFSSRVPLTSKRLSCPILTVPVSI